MVVDEVGRLADDGKVLHGIPGYQQHVQAIELVSDGAVTPLPIQDQAAALRQLIAGHPLISLTEVAEALDLAEEGALTKMLRPLVDKGVLTYVTTCKGTFFASGGVKDA